MINIDLLKAEYLKIPKDMNKNFTIFQIYR